MRAPRSSDRGRIEVRDPLLRDQFAQLPMAVFCAPELSTGAKLTYAILLRLAWERGSSYPGHQACSDRFGPSVASLKRYLAELEAWGLVASYRESFGSTNSYHIFRPDDPECKLKVRLDRLNMSLKGAQTEPEEGSELAENVVKDVDSVSDSVQRDDSASSRASAPTAHDTTELISLIAQEFAPGEPIGALETFLEPFGPELLTRAAAITRGNGQTEKPIAYLYGVVKRLAAEQGAQGAARQPAACLESELSASELAAAEEMRQRVFAWVRGGRKGPPPGRGEPSSADADSTGAPPPVG